MDIATSPVRMELLMEADAIGVDCEQALFAHQREITWRDVTTWFHWHEKLAKAARQSEYFPQVDQRVTGKDREEERGSDKGRCKQLHDTYMKT